MMPPDTAPPPADSAGLASLLARGELWRGGRLAGGAGCLASGHAALDAELPGGGWPRGALVELLQARAGIGELSLLLPALAAASSGDQWVLLHSPPWRVCAPAWQAAGVRLSRLVLLEAAPPPTRRGAADALWAAEQILRAGSVAVALLWLPRSVTPAQLRRLQVAAENGGSTGFVLQDEARLAHPSPAPLRLRLSAQQGRLQVELLKRRGAPLTRPLRLPLAFPPGRAAAAPVVSAHALARPGLSPTAA